MTEASEETAEEKKPAKAKKRKLANIQGPIMEAITGGHYRLPDEAAAIEKIDWLKTQYIVSRQGEEEEFKQPALVMWVRGWEISEAEKKKGYFGQFALVSYKKLKDKSYTLTANKIEMDLKQHPERRYSAKKQQHPNWGHPVLREIKKGKTYTSVKAAEAKLEALHKEYPNASIPGAGKLYLMIFTRAKDSKKPLTKFVFEIEALPEGGCKIDWYENTYKPSDKKKQDLADKMDDPEHTEGFFATRVTLSKRRRRPGRPLPSEGGEDATPS